MCITNSIKYVQKVLDGPDKIVVYKVLTQNYSPKRLNSIVYSKRWKVGINTYCGAEKSKRLKNKQTATRGLYVYKSKRRAMLEAAGYMWNRKVVVAFTARKQDILAADSSVLVFKKLLLTKTEYDRVMKS